MAIICISDLSLYYVRTPAEISLATNYEGDLQDSDNPQDHLFGAHAIGRDSHGTHTSTTRSAISKHLDVEELEMLLEAYFVQIDGTLNKLSTVYHLHFTALLLSTSLSFSNLKS